LIERELLQDILKWNTSGPAVNGKACGSNKLAYYTIGGEKKKKVSECIDKKKKKKKLARWFFFIFPFFLTAATHSSRSTLSAWWILMEPYLSICHRPRQYYIFHHGIETYMCVCVCVYSPDEYTGRIDWKFRSAHSTHRESYIYFSDWPNNVKKKNQSILYVFLNNIDQLEFISFYFLDYVKRK
jgi:hypothetical protein